MAATQASSDTSSTDFESASPESLRLCSKVHHVSVTPCSTLPYPSSRMVHKYGPPGVPLALTRSRPSPGGACLRQAQWPGLMTSGIGSTYPSCSLALRPSVALVLHASAQAFQESLAGETPRENNLYVKNLPLEVDDVALRAMFQVLLTRHMCMCVMAHGRVCACQRKPNCCWHVSVRNDADGIHLGGDTAWKMSSIFQQ